MSSLIHIGIKQKDILILGKGATDGLDDTMLTAEKEFYICFTEQKEKLCLSLHCNGVNSYIFVNGVQIYKFKSKEINASPLCLGNISKDVSVDNTKKTELHGYVYDFSVDYDIIDVHDIWIFINI